MKVLKNLAILVWRIWFYAWFIGTIIVALPVLLIITAKESWYPAFFKIARAWGKTLLFVMGFKASTISEETIEPRSNYMFCANHTSMIDIMLMLAVVKNPFVFVGKAELGKIPIFGYFYKRTCILVDRNNPSSRKAVFAEAERRLKNGLSVCIFPEGLVPDDESIVLSPFKNGAFILAIEHKIPIVPMTFYDCKKRLSYTFFSGCPGALRVKIHAFIQTEHSEISDRHRVNKQAFDTIYNELILDANGS
ncbi:MAG: 1-acyl-sn-glycerol-3-phosphate acyltransferase [Bacteroidetes bacterium MedPE-SWsnd-G1]|nr:MAG: 1-acyl-sn-glycerol-3-phosphate acyltransferase [Bacteroidetes bacterium MedPE-SWsnd-G1]